MAIPTWKVSLEFTPMDEADTAVHIQPPKNRGDSGCDLCLPAQMAWAPGETKFVGFRITAKMILHTDAGSSRVGFCLYPRSSISKTPLRLANSVGVIDAGYDGEIIAALTNISATEYCYLDEGTRLVQVCHPMLIPFTEIQYAGEIVSADGIGNRGAGGFGSTGAT